MNWLLSRMPSPPYDDFPETDLPEPFPEAPDLNDFADLALSDPLLESTEGRDP